MQNGPNKVDVTPNKSWRYFQLMQIQVDLKYTNTKSLHINPKSSLGFKGQNVTSCLENFLGRFDLNFEAYVKSL